MDKMFLFLKVVVAVAIVAFLLKLRRHLVSPEQTASQINQLSGWMISNKEKVLRYTRVVQAVVGLFLLLLGYCIGREHFHVIREGVRTQGTTIGYKQENLGRNYSRTADSDTIALLPIVKFQAGDQVVQFKDWMDSGMRLLNVRVTVLYDPANPSSAMIDRPVWNWIPWAPTFAVGLFLFLVAAKAWLRPPINEGAKS